MLGFPLRGPLGAVVILLLDNVATLFFPFQITQVIPMLYRFHAPGLEREYRVAIGSSFCVDATCAES